MRDRFFSFTARVRAYTEAGQSHFLEETMFKFKFFLAVAAISIFTSTAQAKPCDKVEVSVAPFTYKVNDDRTARQMLSAMLSGNAFNTSDESMALGMLVAKEDNNVSVHQDDNGCYVYTVKAGFAPATLYIANELKESVCGYRHIQKHEMEHVEIYRNFLSGLSGSLSGTLGAVVTDNPEAEVSTTMETLRSTLSSEFAKVYPLQHAIDSTDDYLKNEKVCRGILMRIAKGV